MDGITELQCNMKEMMLRDTLSSLEEEDDVPDVQRLISGMTRSTDHLQGFSFTPSPDHPVTPPPPPPPPPAHPPINIISQAQCLQNWQPANIPAATSVIAALPHPHVNLEGVRVPEGVTQRLSPVGYLNGQMVYAIRPVLSPPPLAAAPQRSSSTTKKRRRRRSQHDDGRPYVKKPPNAFMLFMKERRPILQEQFVNRGSREVTTMLGDMWKAMSSAEQDQYFQESYRLKRLHYQQHPDWIPNSSKKTSSDSGPGRLC